MARIEVEYFGFSNVSFLEAIADNRTGSVWQDDVDYHYYVTEGGTEQSSTGWYVLTRDPDNVEYINGTEPTTIPDVTTNIPVVDTETTATCGGAIINDGNANITAKGVCWSTEPNPTTANSKTTDGTGITAFSSALTGLTQAETYYIRAYATNSAGTGYGNERVITMIVAPEGTVKFDVSIYIKVGIEDIIVKGEIFAAFESYTVAGEGGEQHHRAVIGKPFISYPDSRAYKMALMYVNPITEVPYLGYLALAPSRSYNYSYAVGNNPYTDGTSEYEALFHPGKILCELESEAVGPDETSRDYKETNVIIASETAAPFYFPVEHSYKIGGNIKALALMVEQISEAQTGQYPVVVLTDKGVFALQQGTGIVLYSNLIPISNDKCETGAVQTKNGIAYIANRSVNVLIGRQPQNLSFPLENRIDENLRANLHYITATDSSDLYEIADFVSQVDFRDYILGAILLYDSEKEEIIVTNKDYKYSYVYSMRTQLWHKLSCVFTHSSGRYALLSVSSTYADVVDITNEDVTGTAIVHLQTRPSKLTTEGYKTITRAILRGELYPDTNPFGVYIFASNDLIDWVLVCAAQTEQDIPYLRLYRASVSYRYFTIVAGGIVDIKHNLAFINVSVEDKLTNKDR